jgi:hypothetical protein
MRSVANKKSFQVWNFYSYPEINKNRLSAASKFHRGQNTKSI